MKKLIFGLAMISSLSVFAMQTPMQRSSNTANKLIEAISSDRGLQMLSISKISIGDNSAKVELLDNNGSCSAYPFEIKADNQGQTSVEIMTDSIAQCD